MPEFHEITDSQAAGPVVRVGVIGYGFMGKVHSNAFLKIPYSFDSPAAFPRLYALCGRDEVKTLNTACRFGYRGYYTDWRALVEDAEIQIVDVCTPDSEHHGPAIAAAEAGKHVICEKPLAMNLREAKAMTTAVKKAGVKNMLCHSYRFIPAIRLAKNLIDSGALGRLYHFHARYLQEPGHDPYSVLESCWYASGTKSGVLLGIGSHIIDMARFLVGEIELVSGLLKTYNATRQTKSGNAERVSVDEANFCLVQFVGGVTGTLESSAVATGRKNFLSLEVNGSKGSILFDLEDPNRLQVYTDEVPKEIRGFSAVSVTDTDHPLQIIYLPPGHNGGWEYGHVHALHHFIDAVVNNGPVAPYGATFEDGYRVQAVMQAIAESSRTGQRIELAY